MRARKHHTAFLETTLAHRARRASYPLAEGPVRRWVRRPRLETAREGVRATRDGPSTGPLGYARLARLIRVVWVPPRDSRCLLPLPPLRPSRVARRRSTRIRNDGRMTDTPSARSPGAPQARSTRLPRRPRRVRRVFPLGGVRRGRPRRRLFHHRSKDASFERWLEAHVVALGGDARTGDGWGKRRDEKNDANESARDARHAPAPLAAGSSSPARNSLNSKLSRWPLPPLSGHLESIPMYAYRAALADRTSSNVMDVARLAAEDRRALSEGETASIFRDARRASKIKTEFFIEKKKTAAPALRRRRRSCASSRRTTRRARR